MIDYEKEIFNAVRPAVMEVNPKCTFKSVQIRSESELPAVSFMEIDNRTVRERQSTTNVENYADITYEAQVYAMTKAECRGIFRGLDEQMIHLGFSRLSGDYVPNKDNPNVFRYVARYEAEIDRDGVIYRKP